MDQENSNEVTGLLVTPGVGLRVMAALAGLDRASEERREMARAFGTVGGISAAQTVLDLGPVRVADPGCAVDPRAKRREVSPSRRHARHGRRRMGRAQRQFSRAFYVPSRLIAWWAAVWVGTVLITSSLMTLLVIKFIK